MSAQIETLVIKAEETKILGESSFQIDTLSEIPLVLSQRNIKNLTKVLDALKQCRVKKDNYAFPTPEMALRRASAAGKTEVVKILLNFVSDLDINQPNSSGQTAIFLAKENNKLDIVDILSKISRTLISNFCRAAKDNDIKTLKELINRVDVNAPYDRGVTALHFACAAGRMEIVFYLVEQMGDLDQLDEYNPPRTPRSLLSAENGVKLADYFLSQCKEYSKPQRNEESDEINKLQEVEEKTFAEFTKMFERMRAGDMSLFEKITSYGADNNRIGLIFRDVLISTQPKLASAFLKVNDCHFYAAQGNLKALKLSLFRNPSFALAPDILGFIPLYDAIRRNRTEVVNYFIFLNIKPDTLFQHRMSEIEEEIETSTLLHECAERLDVATLQKMVLIPGINLLCVNSDNNWPIMEALQENDPKELEAIIATVELLYDPKMKTTPCPDRLRSMLIQKVAARSNDPCRDAKMELLCRLGQKRSDIFVPKPKCDPITFLNTKINEIGKTKSLIQSLTETASAAFVLQRSESIQSIAEKIKGTELKGKKDKYLQKRKVVDTQKLLPILKKCQLEKDEGILPSPELALRRASAMGDLDIINNILELVLDLDINQAGPSGKNALMIAEECGKKSVCDFLVERGAKKIIKNFPQRFI